MNAKVQAAIEKMDPHVRSILEQEFTPAEFEQAMLAMEVVATSPDPEPSSLTTEQFGLVMRAVEAIHRS